MASSARSQDHQLAYSQAPAYTFGIGGHRARLGCARLARHRQAPPIPQRYRGIGRCCPGGHMPWRADVAFLHHLLQYTSLFGTELKNVTFNQLEWIRISNDDFVIWEGVNQQNKGGITGKLDTFLDESERHFGHFSDTFCVFTWFLSFRIYSFSDLICFCCQLNFILTFHQRITRGRIIAITKYYAGTKLFKSTQNFWNNCKNMKNHVFY